MTGNFLSVLTTPGFAIAGVLFVCVVGCLAMVSLRLRAVSQQLEILSSAFDEEWRRIANLQRSVEEMTEFVSNLTAQARTAQNANFSAASLYEELKGLQAEMTPEAELDTATNEAA